MIVCKNVSDLTFTSIFQLFKEKLTYNTTGEVVLRNVDIKLSATFWPDYNTESNTFQFHFMLLRRVITSVMDVKIT